MTAKNSISITEVLRVVANEADRNKALLNNLDHAVAEKKCVSVLYLSLEAVTRKTFTDKNTAAKIAEIPLQEMMTNCKDTLDTKRNWTLDRFRFLSKKQMQSVKLEQFWQSLNRMASECDFVTQTESLVHDVFIHNMRNPHSTGEASCHVVQRYSSTLTKGSPRTHTTTRIGEERNTKITAGRTHCQNVRDQRGKFYTTQSHHSEKRPQRKSCAGRRRTQ